GATVPLVEPFSCPPSSCPGHYPRRLATTGTLLPWALLPGRNLVVAPLIWSTFSAPVRPLPLLMAGCPAGRSRGRIDIPPEAGIRVSASFPAVIEHTHWDWGSSHPALPMRGLTRSGSRSLDARPYAASPTCCFPPLPFGAGRCDVLSAFFPRRRLP